MFATEGARTVVVDIRKEGGEETLRLIREDGGEAIFVKASVLSTDEIKAMVEEVVKAYGRIDVLHNNAGGWQLEQHDTVLENTEAEWDKLVDLNLKSIFLVSKQVLPQMVGQGEARSSTPSP